MKSSFSPRFLPMAGTTCALACSSSANSSSVGACGSFDAVVALSDYTSSEAGLISLAGASDYSGGRSDLGKDPALASSRGRSFWIARDLGSIIELDTSCLSAKSSYNANDPGASGSTNPYDVAVAPDGSLWIARFNVSSLLVLNADGTRRRTIDLSKEDPVDGNPNMNSIRILDPAEDAAPQAATATASMATSKAYVSLEILDDGDELKSTRKSKLARIDLESGVVEDVLTLAGRNPVSAIVQLGRQLYLADAGTWCTPTECSAGQPDAGIERVDTASFTSKLLVTGVALGGHASEVAVTPNCGAVIVAGGLPDTPTSLVEFDPTTGSGTPTLRTILPTTTTFTLQGLAWIGGDALLVGDRGLAEGPKGIHVFDTDLPSGCSLRERSATLPLPVGPVAFLPLR
jgi:hypothetical protein